MKNYIKYIFIFVFVLTITFLTSDNNVYADTFDENYAVVSENTLYSFAVDWDNGHGDRFSDKHPSGTKIPYVKVNSLSSSDKVYAFWYYYKPVSDSDYYLSGIYFVSKSSFEINCSRLTWNYPLVDTSTIVPYAYNGYYFALSEPVDWADHYDSGGLGGVTGIIKDNPIQTYDLHFTEYDKNINILDKIVEFLNNGESDAVSSSDGRTDGDSDDGGEYDESIGHLKNVKLQKHHVRQSNGGAQHTVPVFQLYWDNKTSKDVDLTSSDMDIQYKIEMFSSVDGKSTYASDSIGLFYGSNNNHCATGLTKKENDNKNLWISSSCQDFSDLYDSVTRDIPKYSKCIIHHYYWVRPCKKVDGQIKYGTWSRVHITNEESWTDDNYDYDSDYSENDTEADSNDYTPDSTDSNSGQSGSGDDCNESEDDANSKKGSNSSVTFDSVKDLLTQIGNVPLFIGTLFSFLPSWCLNLVGAAFAMFVILMIVKIVRG